MSSLLDRIASLSPEDLQALKDKLAGQRKRVPPQRIPRQPRDAPDGGLPGGAFPVSFAQRRLWFHQQLQPESVDYNLFGLFDVPGNLDLPALRRALAALVEQHEALRTTFEERPGEPEPAQVVHSRLTLDLPLVDLSGLAEPALSDESSRVLEQGLGVPFDFVAGPLLRLVLTRLENGEHLLYLYFPHILSDAWSQRLVYRDLDIAYEAARRGRPVPAGGALQYADFAVWQREQLQGERLERLLAYWRGQLAGDPPVLELPGDRPRDARLSRRGRRESLGLRRAGLEHLTALARAEGATMMMALLAGYALQLHRLSGEEDLLIGSPAANRDRPELQEIVGFFVNLHVLRVRLAGVASFRALLRQVKEVCLGALAHQELPFERLVEELRPERDPSRNPFVEVVLNFIPGDTPRLDAPVNPADTAGTEPEVVMGTSGFLLSQFDYMLVFQEERWGFFTEADHRADLFDATTVRRWLAQLEILLHAAASQADAPLDSLDLLSPAERHQILTEWNDTAAASSGTIHSLVAAQAARTPDAIALAEEATGRQWTYRELDETTDRIAHALRRHDIGPEDLVAVWAERRIETVAAILGILKAGAAYLPLDPRQPEERCRAVLAESGALRLELEGAPSPLGCDLRLSPGDLATDGTALPAGDPDQLAYVMYTSGSTGRPKGVAVPHRGVVRLARGSFFAAGPGDAFLQIALIGFDASTFEIWACLANGARLEIHRPDLGDLAAFGRFVRERGVTHAFLTTELFHSIVREGLEDWEGVRRLLFGGDVISTELTHAAVLRLPAARLAAVYGPTENTTFTTCADLTPETPFSAFRHGVPLGQPISSTSALVLDATSQPAAIGAVGELACGGAGLARGYLGDPARTAAAFVPHPAPNAPGERLYRTGDLARQLGDGTLVFLGRRDRQVKIRGFRVEPGEIESVLDRHPEVADSAVLVLPKGSGGKRLVAFYRARAASDPPAVPELRSYLRQHLPEPMVPEALVAIPQWPVTPNGKIDLAALARYPTAVAEDETETAGSRSLHPLHPVEAEMLALWRDLLGVPRVGLEDSFFDLGGHSLLATRLISAVRRTWGVEVPLRLLFDHPTARALARTVLESRAGTAPPIVPVDRDRPLPLSFAQQRLWFLDRLEPGGTQYVMAEALPLDGHADVAALARALSAIVRRHEVLRTRFAEEAGGEPVQAIDSPSLIPLPVVDLTALPPGTGAGREAAASAARLPFDLATGPVLRALLLRRAAGDILVLTLHHIAADGWSLRILERELRELYAGFAQGQEVTLPPLPVQYADFAVWQRQWLSGETLERQLAFWRERLGQNPPPLDLPADRPRPAVQSFAGAVRTLALAPGLDEPLRELARKSGATLSMTLLAAFTAWLGRASHQRAVVVGSPIANRNRAEVEPLIGFFVNTLVLRFEVKPEAPFSALLAQVRESTLGAYDHQDLPFEKLVEELSHGRDLSRHPLYQVLFDFHFAEDGGATPGADELPRDSAICDLSLSLFASPSGLLAGAEYATALFDGITVERWLHSFGLLLAGAVAAPEATVAGLPLLGEAERHQLLVEWGGVPEPAPLAAPTAHRQIAARALADPDVIAIEQGERRVTYGELWRATRTLAARLREHGIEPEARVAVTLPRSPEMIAALLAVLEAGGAFQPVDPETPPRRLARLQEGAAAILDATSLVDWDNAAEAPELPEPHPEQLAYVIHTSGSTGEPKGVMVAHGALARYTRETAAFLDLGPGDRILQFAALGFDVLIEEVFPTLAAGATLVLPPGGGLLAPSELTRLCREAPLTGFEIPTHLWSEWTAELAAYGERLPDSLRHVIIGTERVAPQRLEQWRRLGAPLIHVLGVTEATVTTLAHRVAPTDPLLAPGELLPVGRPLAGTRAHALDPRLGMAPIGAVGELAIGGAGVARGYLGRPAETAERFVPDPWSPTPGARLYRTGDLVRRRHDGKVVFLGRADQQVKIQGVRIELGEIERILAGHPEIAQAHAAVRGDLPGGPGIVAYLVARPQAKPEELQAELKALLRNELPAACRPVALVLLDALPVSPHGKIDEAALPPPGSRPAPGPVEAPSGDLERRIGEVWQSVLGLDHVGAEESFFEVGGTSLLLVRVHARLRETLGREIPLVELFRYPTVRALAAALTSDASAPEQAPRRPAEPASSPSVAVVGLAGRFPGAPDVETFWRNLRAGVESLTTFSPEELRAAGLPAEETADPSYVPRRGVLDDVAGFDAAFFGMSPREAELLDPQHRLFLETAWTALEHSGHDPKQFDGRIGVFAGCSRETYSFYNLLPHGELMEATDETQLSLASSGTFLPTRTSYKLDLRGPSVNVQTACSTSLVAVALAHRSLLAGECDVALAGGSSLAVPRSEGYLFREGGILSPDGRCLPFDAAARGTVGGEGVGMVVLKRLADALADGDTVHAVLKGSAVNNDGANKVGFTAPSIDGQAEVIARAQEMAGVGPREIGYVETHGTGTALGDPTEIAALTQVFRRGTADKGFCALGSVKHNIGHADDAAGVAGLIKAVLALRHGEIPPSPYLAEPNPLLGLAESPFRIPREAEPWPEDLRRAAVSSFGIGGTNAHAILEAAPPRNGSPKADEPQLLVLSARTAEALAARRHDLADALAATPEDELVLADVAFTLQRGRQAMAHRAAFVVRERNAWGKPISGAPGDTRREVAFLFPGQGSLPGTAVAELLDREPVFAAEVERCAELIGPELGRDLRALLAHPDDARLTQTDLAQPVLFVVEHALARWWMARGVRPTAMIGHSLGEYVAACLAGVLSLEDALRLVVRRGRWMQGQPEGAMTAVSLGEEELRPWLDELGLDLAAVNAPDRTVVSGAPDAVAALEAALAEREVGCRRLATSRAFHSRWMAPVAPLLREAFAGIALSPPRIPYVSTLTGRWITAEEACSPAYWAEHLLRPVQLAAGFQTLASRDGLCALEVGPGDTLAKAFSRSGPKRPAAVSLPAQGTRSAREGLLAALGRLWVEGVPIDWRAALPAEESAGSRRPGRVPLPTYPFERQRYWIDPPRITGEETLEKQEDPARWFYVPSWEPAPLPRSTDGKAEEGAWLILGDAGHGEPLAEILAGTGAEAVRAEPDSDPMELLRRLEGRTVGRAVYVVPEADASTGLLRFVQAWSRVRPGQSLSLVIAGEGFVQLAGEPCPDPRRAEVLALARVIPQELPHVSCRTIDLGPPRGRRRAERLLGECRLGHERAVAWRGGDRFVERFAPLPLAAALEPPLPPGAVVLITGGLGDLGLFLAGVLHCRMRARLVLLAREPLPPRESWPALVAGSVAGSAEEDRAGERLRRLLDLEDAGAEILVTAADVSDSAALAAAVEQAHARFGRIQAVLHLAGLTSPEHYPSLLDSNPEVFAAHRRPKLLGLEALERALAADEPAVCVAFSSLATVLGGLGHTAYAAANLAMEAAARELRRTGGLPWVSVAWDGWLLDTPDETSPMGATHRLALTGEEGAEALLRLLGHEGVAHVVVSTAPLAARLAQWSAVAPPSSAYGERAALPSHHERPALSTGFTAPRDEFEEEIAGVWRDLLGLDRVGVHDNFYELGGDSLLAIHAASRVGRALGVEITGVELLAAPTVEELAVTVLEKLAASETDESLAGELAAIEREIDLESGLPAGRQEDL